MKRAPVVQFKTNFPPQIHKRIASAAKARGVVVNKEIVERVAQSFVKDDLFGDPVLLDLARLMAAAFKRGALTQMQADELPSGWQYRPGAYLAGVKAVEAALLATQPARFITEE
jgi:Arc-like DNA binding domain